MDVIKKLYNYWLGFGDVGNHYDGNMSYPHPYVFCTLYGAIVDPDPDAEPNISENVAKQTGFVISAQRMDFSAYARNAKRWKVRKSFHLLWSMLDMAKVALWAIVSPYP
jgi:hypothetical protein